MKLPCVPERELREGIAFSLLPGVGCAAFRYGVEQHGDAAAAFRAKGSGSDRGRALREADAMIAKARAAAAAILLQGEPAYPDVLLELPDPPRLLFALGTTALLAGPRVGIVGTRHSSPAGDRIAREMAGVLARAGAVVVSGMAFGIDAAAHHGALAAGGGTIAVLGGGADVPYPPSHAALHSRIVKDGLVLSEAPLGSRPGKGAFPKRNRIIAALSDVLIVVEAGERSGALITAGFALDLGRTVAAVPGPIDSPRHIGSNRLLSQGAAFVGTLDDVLSIAGIDMARGPKTGFEEVRRDSPAGDGSALVAILNAVRAGASDLDDLARSTSLTPREFAGAISTLELAGHLVVSPGGSVAIADTG